MGKTKKTGLHGCCRALLFGLGMLFYLLSRTLQAEELKPRLVVLTDIGPNDIEPDDRESMIRLLASADLFEIEVLCAGTGWNTGNYPPGWSDSIRVTIDAYALDLPNLMKRSGQQAFLPDESKQAYGYWPSAAYLRSRTMLGSAKMGYAALGASNNSAGSDQIIKLADEDDERPLHIAVWGGANTLAQAIWRVQQERSAAELTAFLHKLQVYTITDQDKPWGADVAYSISSHQWMRREFEKDLLFIWDECAWLYQNSTGVNQWSAYAANIQGHGHLGGMYPKYRWGVEGDTPSFMYLMAPGLSDRSVPSQGSWGGYAEWMKSPDGTTYAYTNYEGTRAYDTCFKYVKYFYPANFNNFAARMDWAQDGRGNRNPVVVVDGDSTFTVKTVSVLQGSVVTVDASGSYDPDGNALTFKWWIMTGAGTWVQPVRIANATSSMVAVTIPAGSAGKTFHLIGEVTDNGSPVLTGYRRVIVESREVTSIDAPLQQVVRSRQTNSASNVYDLRGRRISLNSQHTSAGRVVICSDGYNRVGLHVVLGRAMANSWW